VGGQERGEELSGTELGSRRQGAERLGPKGGVEVEGVPSEHREVVAGGVVRPVETELRRVGTWLAGLKNGGEGIGQAWFGESWERRIDVWERDRRQGNQRGELTGDRARRVRVGRRLRVVVASGRRCARHGVVGRRRVKDGGVVAGLRRLTRGPLRRPRSGGDEVRARRRVAIRAEAP
jgi:hypothetical protein